MVLSAVIENQSKYENEMAETQNERNEQNIIGKNIIGFYVYFYVIGFIIKIFYQKYDQFYIYF